ncbi:kDa class I heat shock -like [Chlorella sorokiniana]|uniref:KDa class I heat shock-like n=1 Tax=Chlorella sorokiniana TaxID=3076 RepID=A0A2P6TQ54_CHLSO|nr:kDa class I heat shock -like [Chlorella sorokiniana]|eukprot:PRW56154.1 kDa class I heat shock -like [Chlorella sorokiniana]
MPPPAGTAGGRCAIGSLWRICTRFDPFYGLPGGLDPYALSSLLGGYGYGAPAYGAPGYGAPPPPAFLDPFWVPGAGGVTRRRLNVPIEGEGGGAAGTGAGAAAGSEAGKGAGAEAGAGAGGEAGVGAGAGAGQEGQREKEYIVRADMPGAKKSEIHVEVHDGNVLRFGHVPGSERQKEDEEEEGVYHRAERVTTFRNRNLRMPEDADMSGDLQAKYEDGVLHVTIPKKEGRQPTGGRAIEVA